MLILAGAGLVCGMGVVVFFLKKRNDHGTTTISVR